MTSEAKKLATYDDLVALPSHVVGEIIAGELHVSPRPAPRHALTASALGGSLFVPFQKGQGGPGGWWILDEPELHLGEHAMVPDLAGWRKERMPHPPEGNGFTVSPDWICEVLSPGTMPLDRTIKMPLYAKFGVSYAWLIDPLAKTLEVFKLNDEKWVLLDSFSNDQMVSAEPFQEVNLELGSLWWE